MNRKHPAEYITEKDITVDLFPDVKAIKRNSFVYSKHFESDIICYLECGYYTEIEFKNNVSDFQLDFTKCIGRMKSNDTRRRRKANDKRIFKHDLIKKGKTGLFGFYFACPAGVIDIRDVPDYCGLIWLEKDLFGKVEIKLMSTAPILPKAKKLTPFLL